jgi:predicted nucleotide-binding protein (sugar kinase/HSP70/actin superfamily)
MFSNIKNEVLRVNSNYDPDDLRKRILWIPYAYEGAHMLAAAFRAFGVGARVLPRSKDTGLCLAREAIPEDVCLPSLVTIQDMLERVNDPEFDRDHESFFIGNSEGPCRFGMYEELMRRILAKIGYPDVPVVTLGIMGVDGGMGIKFPILAWDLLLAHDLLRKMLLRARPYEQVPGESGALYKEYINKIVEIAPKVREILTSGRLNGIVRKHHLKPIVDILEEAQQRFIQIRGTAEDKPLIVVIGEFFVRIHDGANQDTVGKLEREGFETWEAPATEFFAYANFVGKMLSRDRLLEAGFSKEELREFAERSLNAHIMEQHEHALFHACTPFLNGYDDIGPKEVISNGREYVDYNFGGEAICSMGKSVDAVVRRRAAGIVSLIPFNCMPGNCVTALSTTSFRKQHNRIPFLNLDYDGYHEASRDMKIVNFGEQARAFYAGYVAVKSHNLLDHMTSSS